MFKAATIYKMAARPEGFSFEEKLQDRAFVPCQPTQEKSVGWVPPRGHENGLLMEVVAGQYILKAMIETKSVPASAFKFGPAARYPQVAGRRHLQSRQRSWCGSTRAPT